MAAHDNLYLVLDLALADAGRARDMLATALAAAPVATVLLSIRRDTPSDAALAKELVALGQSKGAAVLIADDATLARGLKADGVHLTWRKDIVKAYREARDMAGSHAIVGADAGPSRHDAMELGEAGADYIAFGIPPHVEDIATARARQADLVAWWNEIFEIPCVAFDVTTLDVAAAIAAAGADFVATSLPTAAGSADLTAFIRSLHAGLVPSKEPL